mgnify:CR=1 FL=1
MLGSKPGVMIYFETLQAIDTLGAEDAKQVLHAILHYARDGESPSFQGTLAAFWFLIQSNLDRDGDRYNTRRMRGLWLTYCRKCKESGVEPLSFEEWEAQQSVNDTLSRVERFVNAPSPTPTPTPTPTTTPTPTASTSTALSPTPTSKREYREGCGEGNPSASKQAIPSSEQSGAAAPTPAGAAVRHKHGAYGWVRLTDDEYARLLNDLGEDELVRCITYLDESAQSNGNKNKWKDWNLVVRRCSRERWGIRGNNGGGRPSASESAMGDLQQLHQMYASEDYE